LTTTRPRLTCTLATTAFEGTPEDKDLRAIYGKPKRSREADRPRVRYCKINGYEILEQNEWAGKWIPVIRIVGNEFEVDGRLYVSGLVRNAKDAQRMYNYWVSQEAEMLALAPKAPFIGYGGQFEGYEDKWKTANTNNWPYLEVNPDVTDGQGAALPLPQRAQPPMASSGLLQAKAGALKTSSLQLANTTRPLAKAATSGLEKLFLRASVRVTLVLTTTVTT
jgi:hypothetical protein